MLETAIIVSLVFCGSAMISYLCRLLFMSKCSNLDICCLHIKRNTSEEQRNVSSLNLHH